MLIYDLAYFDIRICVGLWSVCCRFVIDLSSGLSVCCRLRFQDCANGRFSFGVVFVIYRSQIGRFHTESCPKWPRHEPDWFYGVFSNIVGGRQQDDSLKNLRFLSVSCRFGRCDWGIPSVAELKPTRPRTLPDKTDTTPTCNRQTTDNLSGGGGGGGGGGGALSNMFEISLADNFFFPIINWHQTDKTESIPTVNRSLPEFDDFCRFQVGFVSVWPVWLGLRTLFYASSSSEWQTALLLTWFNLNPSMTN